MPILHIVLVKYAPSITLGEIQAWKAAASGLAKIPAIKKLEIGQKLGHPSDKGYDEGIVITFENKDDLAAYMPHPIHEAYKESTKPFVADKLIFDLEV